MGNEAFEARERSDYAIIRLGKHGPQWFRHLVAGYQWVYRDEPILERIGPSTLEIVGVEHGMVQVTLKDGPTVSWLVPKEPHTDAAFDLTGELSPDKPSTSTRRFELILSSPETGQRLTLQGDFMRNVPVRTGI